MDIISEFLGFDLEEVAKISEQQKDQSVKIVTLTETEEWKVFENYLKLLADRAQKPLEVYAQNPDQAKYDVGYKRSLADIQSFIDRQKLILKQYAEETKESGQASGGGGAG